MVEWYCTGLWYLAWQNRIGRRCFNKLFAIAYHLQTLKSSSKNACKSHNCKLLYFRDSILIFLFPIQNLKVLLILILWTFFLWHVIRHCGRTFKPDSLIVHKRGCHSLQKRSSHIATKTSHGGTFGRHSLQAY
jgi:hypothetical protein